jgi:hypothetical protein
MKLLSVISVLLILSSCSLFKKKSTEQADYFTGTIVYDVQVVKVKPDYSRMEYQTGKYGNEMTLTIFENGDIQRKYAGTATQGYKSIYLDLEKNEINGQYNFSDSVYYYQASERDLFKLSDAKTDAQSDSILGYATDQLAMVAEEPSFNGGPRDQLVVKYWYNNSLKLNSDLYEDVSAGLWNYYTNKSEAVYLKMELNYFDFKVIYTAKEINKGIYEVNSTEGKIRLKKKVKL